MKKKRSKLISMLLTLVMTLSLVPAMGVTASAAEPEWTIVNTFDELKEAMQQGTKTNIKLGKDINTNDEENHKYGLTTYDQILVGNTITLDLNGKKLTLNSGQNQVSSYINVTLGNLTVQDSVGGGEIFLNDEYRGGSTLILLLDTATFTLKSGTIRATTKPETSGIDLIQSYGTVNIEGGTLTCTQTNGEIGRLHSDPNHWTSCYALKCFARDNVQTTITGGEFTGFVIIPVKNNGKQNKITNVTFDGSVVLDLADEKNMTWSKPGLTVENAEVKGTLFINGVCYHEKSTDIAIVIGDGWYATLAVEGDVWVYDFDLFKQTYEAGGNDVSKATFKQGYAPYQLKGGTYRYMNFGRNSKGEYDISSRYISIYIQEAFRHILGNGAIKVGNYGDDGYKIYTYNNIRESFRYGDYMGVLNSSMKKIPFIPNAWGMKSVTLDGKKIDYFKDWKGTVEQMDNSTAHTLKFEWYPLAKELKDAGYSYRTKCEHYISGSTAVQKTENIDANATSHTITIEKGVAPKVYSYDLQLNLEKNGSSVGIFTNNHIVKLVVDPAPVVTEISSAPVRLSAALTPDSTAPGATAVGSGYTVESINWYTDDNCTEQANSFVAGTSYYGKIVLKPEKNYKFAASASALFFCNDPNENYVGISSTVAEDGSSLTRVVKGKAVSALVWDSVDTDDQTYTIGNSALMLNAKATGGDSGKPIIYKLIAEKDGTETVKASATVAASLTDGFSAPLGFTETGTYHCRFEATRGNVTITSEPFTVTVNAPGLSITNQSGNLTVKQNATARLFVKAVGHGVKYEWQVKNDGTWEAISGETAYDYAAPTDEVGEKTYRCKVTDKYGEKEFSNEMTVTVTEGIDMTLTPAILLAAVNGDAPDPAELWPDKDVPPSIWLSLSAEYNVTAGETFNGVATFSTIPTGFTVNGRDIYYDSYNGIQKTPVLGTISYEWKGTKTPFATATDGDFKSLGTDAHASFEIPSGVDTYYVKLSVKNKIDDGVPQESTVNITFHVSPAHTHTYAYAQLNKDSHTKYCTAGDDNTTENHDMDNGICTLCGYALAKTYTVNVTNGSANPNRDVTPGTKVTLTADNAPTGQEFDKWVGNVAVASDHTFNMPSHNVTVAATYKPITHTHDYTGQNWAPLNDDVHSRSCKAGDFMEFEGHKFNSWTKHDENSHKATCSECGYEKTENHSWVLDSVKDPTFTAAGSRNYKCSANGCEATKTESIPALIAIPAVNVTVTAPIKDAAPEAAATAAGSPYSVANTAWDPTVSSTFAGGTQYTVKVSLEANGDNRFTDKTTFQINGQTVKPVDTIPATGKDNTIITLTFPATEGGSTSGGSSGGGGGGGVTKYAVAVSPADNGKVTPDKTSAAKGSVVTITAMANDGYALDTIKATDKAGKEIKLTDKGDGKYTFTMPASKVEVKAAFKQTASKPGKPAEEMKTVVVMQVGSKTMFVNGKAYEKDAAPVIMNDRTLVPIRFVTESLGGTVAWNAETKEVTLVIDGKEIKMTIGKTIEKYGVAPVIIDSRTFVPVRFVADELGATTAWNAETKTVTITKAVTPVKTEK